MENENILTKLVKDLLAQIRAIDSKVVTFAASYLLTLLVTKVIAPKVGVAEDILDDVLIPGYLRVDQAIAFVAGAVGGWWKSNLGTQIRKGQESGNPEPPPEFLSEQPTVEP